MGGGALNFNTSGDDRLLRFVFCFVYKFVLLDFSSQLGGVSRCGEVKGTPLLTLALLAASALHVGRRRARWTLGGGAGDGLALHRAVLQGTEEERADGKREREKERIREREKEKGRENTQLEERPPHGKVTD